MPPSPLAASENVQICGKLLKKRGGFGKFTMSAWQNRYFVICNNGVLTYFNDSADYAEAKSMKNPRGRIDLKATDYEFIKDRSIEGAPTTFCMIIQPLNGDEGWKLCAMTKEEMAQWCLIFEKYMHEKSLEPHDVAGDIMYASDDEEERNSLSHIKSSLRQKSKAAMGKGKVLKLEVGYNDRPQNISFLMTYTFVCMPDDYSLLQVKTSRALFEWTELLVTLAMLNSCLYMLERHASSQMQVCCYVTAANLVVAYTLYIRQQRASKPASAKKADGAKSENPLVTDSVKRSVASLKAAGSPSDTVKKVLKIVAESNAFVKVPIGETAFPEVTTTPRLSPDHTWCNIDHRQFSVRIGPHYNANKKKAPTKTPLYTPFAVDVFCSKNRIDHVATRFQLPQHLIDVQTNHPHVPPIFIIQMQIPSEPPSSFLSSITDGPGWAVVMFYRITEDTINQLKDLRTASSAVKLFAQWCERAPTDNLFRGRFKVIAQSLNLEEIPNVPSMIQPYNGKPVLIRRTGTIFKGKGYMEKDIHVHKFDNFAKQGIFFLSSKCGLMYMQIGFVIEGRDDEELPECLFACVGMNRPQEDRGSFLFDEP